MQELNGYIVYFSKKKKKGVTELFKSEAPSDLDNKMMDFASSLTAIQKFPLPGFVSELCALSLSSHSSVLATSC